MTNLSAGSPSSACFAVPSIASINSRGGQSSPLIETSKRGGAWARGVARFRAALMIKLGSARWITSAAIVALTLISGSAVSWAQSCPASPSYSPDFTSNQSCMTLLGNGSSSSPVKASFVTSGGTLLQITPNSQQQRGYAWYNTPQPVGNSFSTTFTFQLTGASDPPADGFAFVIQNSSGGANTVGPTGSDGCGLGFGDDPSGNGCVAATGGITNSVAVGFKTYNSGAGFPNPESVFVASNGTGPNCVDVVGDVIAGTSTPVSCVIAENDLSGADSSPNTFDCEGSGICLADGTVHTVTITYALQPTAAQSACYAPATNAPLPCLDVILDGTDLFPTGVAFNMASIFSPGSANNTAYVGFTGATGGSVENNNILSWVFTPQGFGNINVCKPGTSSPAPCSVTQAVSVNVPSGDTVGSVQVVTQGISNPILDFTLANGGTCLGATGPGTCTVNVTFTPQAPGLRMGAVNLFAGSSPGGTPLATTLIYGVGQGPAVAFSPGIQTTVNTQGNALSVPNGVAVDAAGNVFIAEGGNGHNGQVLKVPANGGQPTTVGMGLDYPQGLAVDGAGNLFIADNNLNEVVEVPAGCTNAGCQAVVPTPQCVLGVSGLCAQLGVAVDGAGDVFVASFNGEVVEVASNGGVQTVVYNPAGANPIGLAVDGAGDLFVADYGLARVLEIPAGCTSSTCWIQVGTGWSRPEAVAVDAAGDVFVADEYPKVVEVPAGCSGIGSSACQITLSNVLAYGVAVDGKGDVFLPDRGPSDTTNGQVVEINRSQSPSLSFATTYVGSTSTDSPQTVSVQNVGNADLTLSAITFPMDFPQVGDENDCTAQSSLIPGQACPLTIEFDPTVGSASPGTALTESVGLTDNALNVSGATQSISVEGRSLSPEVYVPNLVGDTQSAADSAITGAGLVAGAVTYQASTVTIGDVVSESPIAGTQVLVGSSVSVVLSSGVAVPNVVGQTQSAATTAISTAGLALVLPATTEFSDTAPSGTVISQNPAFPSNVNSGSPVSLVVSSGVPPAQDQLTLENNYFVTGDYASAGITLHGAASGTITIPDPSPCAPPNCGPGVPDGADIIDGFLYWTTVETSTSPSGSAGTFLGYSIIGQQIGSDVPNYSDGANTGTLRVYRADVNAYFQVPSNWNGARLGSGTFTVTLPNGGGAITEGASLVVIYRVLSPLFPLKSVVIYDGSIVPAALNAGPIPQAVQGFYDSAVLPNVTGENTILSTSGGSWNNSSGPVTLPVHSNQYIETLTPGNQTPGTGTGNAYAAIIFSTPVSNMNNDGILDAWKTAQGYTDVKTGEWVPLPGATLGEQDLFVQFDYMCSVIDSNNNCEFNYPNLYPSPDAQGNDPLAMVTQAYANIGVHLHLVPGNAILETTCTDTGTSPSQLCMFPNEPGVVTWDGSVQLSKVWPANYAACTANPSAANCAPRFPYGQKDSYHYVLFGYSVAIPSWTTRSGSITSITVSGATANSGGSGSIVTKGLGTTCPTRITVTGVQGNPNLNGIYDQVYNSLTCDSGLTTIYFSTPVGVPNWSYISGTTSPTEPAISVTSGTVTTMSGFSDLGGSDSVVSLGAWATAPAQDMSKAATVVAGTLFHEIGHTLGLTHGGLYFDTPGSYIPTFEANCKPDFQSTMNYLFQIDGLGPNAAIAYSNQALYGEPQGASPTPTILGGDSGTPNPNFTTIPLGSVVDLTDTFGNPATYSTSSWYSTTAPSSTASPATMHCDGTPLTGDTGYRVNGPVDAISPAWATGQNITFDGAQYSDLRGYDDVTSFDLRQVGAASGELAALANEISYRSTGVFYGGSGGLSIGGSGGLSIGGSGGLSIGGSGGLSIGGSGGLSIGGSGGLSIGGSGGLSIGGSGGLSIGGSGGVPTEVDYLTANSIVRPPNSPTLTPVMTNGAVTSVTVDWTAPAFGVVQYYTVYRGCNPNGSDAVNIGVVNGVGGAAPATEFIDSNPVTCSGSSGVIYTIATTLNPVQIDPTQRSSAPSVPAIIKNHQTIVLGPIQSSVTYSTPPPTVPVTATAETNGSPNGLQVNFVATGPCSVGSQTVTPVVISTGGVSGGVSTATVSVNNPGSNPATCTVTASQPGTNPTASSMPPYYDAANSVSESFTIEPAGSTVLPQTISWSTLPNVQYGGTFSLSATAESNGIPDGQPVTFSASGPCMPSGAITGVGVCKITATAPAGTVGSNSYSAASVTQSFTITPAVLTVMALPLSATYEQPLPSLVPVLNVNYSLAGFVKNGLGQLDTSSVVAGAPSLSTTATKGSTPGTYPITISTGSLAAANYSFLYVNGTLTIVQAPAITSANNATFTVGTSGTFAVTTTGYPAPGIKESGALPTGVTFVNNGNGTATLSGKATVSGIYTITLTAQNGVGAAATQSFTLTSETTVPASSTTCNGVYIGTFSGNITVSNGQNCIFEKGGATGNITETGGNLALSNSTIGGNIQVSGGTYAIGPSTTIKGNLTIQSIPTGPAQNLVCGATVGGSLTLQSVGTVATIGSGTTACPANTISESLTLQSNSAAMGVSGNTIKGSVTDQSNSAATTLSGNTISGSLTDQGNSGASVVSLNSITGTLVDQSNSASSVLSGNTVGQTLTDQGNTGPTQVTSNKVTGILLCQSNTSITGSGDTASKLEGQCASF